MTLEVRAEPVVGWRAWNLSDDAEGPTLWPAGAGSDAWPRRRPLEARCTRSRLLTGRRGRHEAPAIDCRCGIYAGDSLEVIARDRPAWPPATVVGSVSLWGRTVVHEHGWRARYAYPARLRVVCVVCAWLEPGPGEATVIHGFFGRRYGFCDAHAGGLELPGGRRTTPTETAPLELRSRLLDAYAVDLLPIGPLLSLYRRPPAPEAPPYVPSVRVIPGPGIAGDEDGPHP